MRIRSKIATLLLIATLASGLWAQQDPSTPVQLPKQSSGCHGQSQGSPTPRPAPVHDCCLTGHDAAIPQVSSVERPPAECHQLAASAVPSSSILALMGLLKQSPIPSAESPGITPLRV
jgi:hypothetical protein